MKTITVEWLKEQRACRAGLRWFIEHKETDTRKALLLMIEDDHADYANWVIVRMMKTHKQKVQYAIFPAEQVLPIFEKEHPNDDRPRKAIEAAKKWVKHPYAAAGVAADAAADAAAAYAAADAAAADADAAADAASAAAAAASAAGLKMHIIHYGTRLIKEETNHERKL